MKLFIGDTLHPILEAYFVTDLFLSNEYNDLTIGEVFAHPNKNKRLTNVSTIDNYSTTFIQSRGDYAVRRKENTD
jgi:hypothetical protein